MLTNAPSRLFKADQLVFFANALADRLVVLPVTLDALTVAVPEGITSHTALAIIFAATGITCLDDPILLCPLSEFLLALDPILGQPRIDLREKYPKLSEIVSFIVSDINISTIFKEEVESFYFDSLDCFKDWGAAKPVPCIHICTSIKEHLGHF